MKFKILIKIKFYDQKRVRDKKKVCSKVKTNIDTILVSPRNITILIFERRL